MTKKCSLKEAFIEKKLNEFQPGWRQGEDIKDETKQKIIDYVASIMPAELKDDAACITNYSILHMARKIRERENLPEPKKSNKGNCKRNDKVSESNASIPEAQKTAGYFQELIAEIKKLAEKFSLSDIRKAMDMVENRKNSGV